MCTYKRYKIYLLRIYKEHGKNSPTNIFKNTLTMVHFKVL